MHPLNTHVQRRSFSESISTIKAKVSPLMNVVDDKLFLSLMCIGQFNHTNHTTSVIEAIKKLTFQLLPIIDRATLQVSVPVKCITFQGMNELFYNEITISSSIVASLHKVSYMLLRIPDQYLKVHIYQGFISSFYT